jgi:hypothetical protein
MSAQPLAAPVFKLKPDSKLMRLHQSVESNYQKVNRDIFKPIYKVLEDAGLSHDEAVNFTFYDDTNFGFMARDLSHGLDSDLKVPKHGFRGFKKTSALFKTIKKIFDDNHQCYTDLRNSDQMLTNMYRGFYTGRRQMGGSMFSFEVLRPEFINDEYYIGGPVVNLKSQDFKDNYEPIEYEDYLKTFAAAIK